MLQLRGKGGEVGRPVAGNTRVPPAGSTRIFHKKDIRSYTQVRVESLTAQFIFRIRQGGAEMAQETTLIRNGNLPDAEEAQDMVYAEGVEVLRHLAHAGFPPGKAVFLHLFPVVGGEAPVLTVFGKGIRRGSGLAVHVEEVRELPGIGTGAAYTDGKVSLKGYTVQMGVVYGFLELGIQQELHIAVKAHLFLVFQGKGLYLFGLEGAQLLPRSKLGRSINISEHAENGIRD